VENAEVSGNKHNRRIRVKTRGEFWKRKSERKPPSRKKIEVYNGRGKGGDKKEKPMYHHRAILVFKEWAREGGKGEKFFA